MIRFPCPGCGAQFTVGNEKAGKSGKCPKCQAEFTIPNEPNLPDGEGVGLIPPPIPEPPPASNDPVEIAPCPVCNSRSLVEPRDLGLDIECPNCQTQYKAVRLGEGAPASKKSSGSVQRSSRRDADAEEDEDRPSRRSKRRDEDDDEERPSRRASRKRDEDEEDDRPSRRSSRRGDDDDDYDRRSNAKIKPGALQAVAIMLLVGGIISCLVALGYIAYAAIAALSVVGAICCLWPGMYYQLVFGIMAIVRSSQMLGTRDLKGPPKGLCIMQIICIVNGDITNCVLGIVGLVLLGNEDVKRWYARRGFRY